MDKQAYNMLTMARLCKPPEDMEELSILAYNLAISHYQNLIHDTLTTFPSQNKVSFDELGDIIDFITTV